MLELRPTCEHCNTDLPPESLDAYICSYECTFCANCVDSVIGNVCLNCGGGFVPRPIRPATNWKSDNFLGKDPASLSLPRASASTLRLQGPASATFASTAGLTRST